jgi:hypothetical protein
MITDQEKEMRKQLKAHEESIETPYILTLKFQSQEVIDHFMVAMCEGVEQEYWNWVDAKDEKWKDPILLGCCQQPNILYDFIFKIMRFVHHNNKLTKALGFYLPPGEEE